MTSSVEATESVPCDVYISPFQHLPTGASMSVNDRAAELRTETECISNRLNTESIVP